MPQQPRDQRGLPCPGTSRDNHTPPGCPRTDRQYASVQEQYVVPAHSRTNTPHAHLGQPIGAESKDHHHLAIPRPPSRSIPRPIKPIAVRWPGQRIQRGVRLLARPRPSPVSGEHAAKPGAVRDKGHNYPARGHTDRREHPVRKPQPGHRVPKAGPGPAHRRQRVVVAHSHLLTPLATASGTGRHYNSGVQQSRRSPWSLCEEPNDPSSAPTNPRQHSISPLAAKHTECQERGARSGRCGRLGRSLAHAICRPLSWRREPAGRWDVGRDPRPCPCPPVRVLTG